MVRESAQSARSPAYTLTFERINSFKSMVPVLDKFTLTEKLVPLLSRIKTKEPSVMLATLAVHEQIGAKCDIQAIATLVLPQLWAMSVTPLLDVGQFGRFMSAIRQLGARVEEEHTRHLAEIKRLEETSGAGSSRGGARSQRNGDSAGMLGSNGAEVDFESLVRGNSAQGSRRAVTPDPFGPSDDFAKVSKRTACGSLVELESDNRNIPSSSMAFPCRQVSPPRL